MASGRLRICLLGELRLIDGDGRTLELPASKRTRALLGYLVATGRTHLRERLCELFWDDGPDDPRGSLRWSLTKLRPLLNDADATRLVADRNHVGFEACGAEIDVATARELLGANPAAAPIEALQEAAALYRGEFLEGLDLPSCYRYQAWCLAEREALSAQRMAVLSALVDRLADRPAEALGYARTLVAIDPLSVSGHCAVVRMLDRLGRQPEAREHYEQATRLIDKELGAPAGKELHELMRSLQGGALRRAHVDSPATPTVAPPLPPPLVDAKPAAFFIGRAAERALLDRLAESLRLRQDVPVLHVSGEPGIGKSHLLDQLRARVAQGGGRTFFARAFEAEIARPYGIWSDIFTELAHESDARLSPEILAALSPELAAAEQRPADKARLFARALEALRRLAADRPLLVALDDLQWIDEGSAALFHYIARSGAPGGAILLACATRTAELEDNPAVANALASLRKERKLLEVPLARLSPEETAELVGSVDPTLDAARAFAETNGNPLFALELARAHRAAADVQGTLHSVIGAELARLTPDARELLTWAAALGRSFDVEILAALAGRSVAELSNVLHELERRCVLSPAGHSAYDFVHDVVRQVAYQGASQPRRKLLHARIARQLAPNAETDDNLASAVAHHAALSNEHLLAARACVLAGERCLRLFANSEARGFAERGLWHLDQCASGPEAAEHRIALYKVQVLAATGPSMRPLPPIEDEVTRAIATAESFGLTQAVMTGHYLLSIIHQEAGRNELAKQSTLRAVRAGRGAESSAYIHQLANTARCLLELETEVSRARALLHEAEMLVEPQGLAYCELEWARGLMQRWDGDAERAAESIGRALGLARGAEDRWREYKCLTWLAMIELERNRPAAARERCADMLQVARKLGDAEVPLAMTLDALAELAAGAHDDRAVVAALEALRAIDDKSHLAYALNAAAALCLGMGRLDAARSYADEALRIAETMQRMNDQVIAMAILARLPGADGSSDDATGRARAWLNKISLEGGDLSRRARSALLEAVPAAQPA